METIHSTDRPFKHGYCMGITHFVRTESLLRLIIFLLQILCCQGLQCRTKFLSQRLSHIYHSQTSRLKWVVSTKRSLTTISRKQKKMHILVLMLLLYFGLLQLKPGCLESFHFLKPINLQHKTIASARLRIRCIERLILYTLCSLSSPLPPYPPKFV